jgi:hypothetical protein
VFSEEKLPMKNIAVFAIFRDRLHAEAAVKEPESGDGFAAGNKLICDMATRICQ